MRYLNAPLPKQDRVTFKYPAEDEPYIRRLGSALVLHWSELPQELRAKLLTEATTVWDRELHIPQILRKIDAFIKRHQIYPSEKAPE